MKTVERPSDGELFGCKRMGLLFTNSYTVLSRIEQVRVSFSHITRNLEASGALCSFTALRPQAQHRGSSLSLSFMRAGSGPASTPRLPAV